MSLNPFRTMMAVFIAVFLGMGMLTSAPSYGAIVSAVVDTQGNGIALDPTISGNDIFVDKQYNQFGPMSLHVEVAFDDGYLGDFVDIFITEEIGNNTGIIWSDFHFELEGNAFFSSATLNEPDPFPFSMLEVTPGAVWLTQGAFLSGIEDFQVTLGVSVFAGVPNETIWINELPTVPIPAALWLFGSGLLVLVGAARRRKMV